MKPSGFLEEHQYHTEVTILLQDLYMRSVFRVNKGTVTTLLGTVVDKREKMFRCSGLLEIRRLLI